MQKQFVLKAKNTVKRVAAISAGITMIGVSLGYAAAATDLSAYPSPFVENGNLNGLVVVGADAAAGDIVGAGDIISTLTQAAVSAKSTTTEVTGGKVDQVDIGDRISDMFGLSLTDTDVEALADSEFTWNGTEYDYHETIDITTDLMLTSATDSGADTDYGTDVVLETQGDGAIEFNWVIDTAFTEASVSESDPLNIDFMGAALRIESWSGTTMTYRGGTQVILGQGESTMVGDSTVTVTTIADGTISVDVDGSSEFLDAGDSEEIGSTGIEVDVDSILYTDDAASRQVILFVGTDVLTTVDDGDSMEIFGEPEDADDAEWVWIVAAATQTIGAEHNQKYDDENDDVVRVGESFTFPNDYASISLTSLDDNTYVEYTIEFLDEVDVGTAGVGDYYEQEDVTAILFTAVGLDDEGFDYNGNNTDKVWIVTGKAGFLPYIVYVNSDGDQEIDNLTAMGSNPSIAFDIEQGDTTLEVNVTFALNATDTITIDLGTGSEGTVDFDDIVIDVRNDTATNYYLGSNQDDADAAEVDINTHDVGTEDFDLMSGYGVIIRNPDSNGNNDEVHLSVPDDQVTATVTIAGADSVTTVTSDSVTVNTVAGVSVIKLDTEVTDPASKNLILVGGPAVNRLTAQVLGLSYPTTGADSTIPENAALIRMIDNAFGGSNSALVVAGWSVDDTRDAASFLQNYAANSLSGSSMTVTGPNTATAGGEVTAE